MSEVVLVDLLSALRFALTGTNPAALQVKILDTKVRDGAQPKSKGELLVDVRASDDDSNFIVEVQRRSEALFHHRALLYASADIVAQQRTSSTIYLKPTHTLAFCDHDFGPPKIAGSRSAIGTSLTGGERYLNLFTSPNRPRRFKHSTYNQTSASWKGSVASPMSISQPR